MACLSYFSPLVIQIDKFLQCAQFNLCYSFTNLYCAILKTAVLVEMMQSHLVCCLRNVWDRGEGKLSGPLYWPPSAMCGVVLCWYRCASCFLPLGINWGLKQNQGMNMLVLLAWEEAEKGIPEVLQACFAAEHSVPWNHSPMGHKNNRRCLLLSGLNLNLTDAISPLYGYF